MAIHSLTQHSSLHVRHQPRFEVPLIVVSVMHEQRKIPEVKVEVLDISEGGAMINWQVIEDPVHIYDTLELVLGAPPYFASEAPISSRQVKGRVVNVSAMVFKSHVDMASTQSSGEQTDCKGQLVNFQFDQTQNWVIPYARHFSPKPKGLWRVWQQHFPKSLSTIGTPTEQPYPRQVEARICHVANYPMASGAGITRLTLDKWLSQFRPPGQHENREKAAYEMDCVLLRLVEVTLLHYYISSERCQARCKLLYRRLRQQLDSHNTKYPDDRISLSDVLFLPIGKPSKSGQLVQYWFRAISDIPASLFEERGALPRSPRPRESTADRQDTRIGRAKLLVFFDDFFGTGETVSGEAIRICEELRARAILEKKYIAFYALAGTQQAINLLTETFGKAPYVPHDHLFDVAVAGKALTLKDLINDHTSDFRHLCPADTKMVLELCNNNKTLFRDSMGEPRPFGYGNVGSLIVFEHNTPNNTLPILWAESPHRTPLFHRHATPDFVPGAYPVVRTAEQMKWRDQFFKELERKMENNQTVVIWGEAGLGKASAVIACVAGRERSAQYYKVPGVIGSRLIWHDVPAAYTEDVFWNSVAGFLSARGYKELSAKIERLSASSESTALTLLDEEVCRKLYAEGAVICFNGINHLEVTNLAGPLAEKTARRLEMIRDFILTVASRLKQTVPVLLLFDTKTSEIQGLPAWSTLLGQRQIPHDSIEVKRPPKERIEEVINSELAAQRDFIEKSDISEIPDIYLVSSATNLATHLVVSKQQLIDELWRVTAGHPLAMGLAIGLIQHSRNFNALKDCPIAGTENPCHQLAKVYLTSLPDCHREIVLNAAIFEEPRCKDAIRLLAKRTNHYQHMSETGGGESGDIFFDLELRRIAAMHKAFLVQLPDSRYGMSDTVRNTRIFRETNAQ